MDAQALGHAGPVAVLVHVPDVRAGRDWYAKAFPAARVSDGPDDALAILRLGGFDVEIVRADEKVSSGRAGSVLYWSVPDVAASAARLVVLGATVHRGPMAIGDGMGMCQVEDPFGNLFGLRGRFGDADAPGIANGEGADVDADLARPGAACHDAGKIVHPEELDAPGSPHEPAGDRLSRTRA